MDGSVFLERMRAGDPKVYDDLYPILRRMVRGACRSSKVDKSIQDDIVQELVLAVFRKWRTFAGQSKLTTWLFQIARNIFISELRKRKRQVRGEDRKHDNDTSEDTPASSRNEPKLDENFELMLCVEQVIADLESQGPARRGSHRVYDVLTYVINHSPSMEQLAEHLGITPQAAKQRMYEIRKRMEELCLKFCGHDDCSLHITGGAA